MCDAVNGQKNVVAMKNKSKFSHILQIYFILFVRINKEVPLLICVTDILKSFWIYMYQE